MNGTQSPDAQKPSNANTNGTSSNNSSLAAKKRKKDLKPIITMEGNIVVAHCLDLCLEAAGFKECMAPSKNLQVAGPMSPDILIHPNLYR
ncbi:CMGC/SRPK protein kinase [Fusarium austroafricanum]|uniref:CMGC/SRPK protein kinase n=1 Tax=Fusarium austroafricanum TaxID=2364996 RepID=A0A8H4NUQ4_9HYPO|nr:CMGC/SRPK protein kinase [Fusarium austroafricanum]